ncbi:DegT/DnrJ/EryC1/StrS family aminotransferase [candidate division KSB1 bacterium]
MSPRPDPDIVPFHRPWITPTEEREMVEVLRSGWLTMGPRTIEFEDKFRDYLGVGQAVAVSSGTAALHLALILAQVRPGDEVITTPLTYAATANEIVHVGAKPVFCDVLPETLCLDPDAVEAALNKKTRAVLPVHYGGLAAPMNRYQAICREHGLALLADCAHALETRIDGKSIALAGDMAAFSFYPNKNITTGEGGMLTLADPDQAARARRLRLHGFDQNSWRKYENGHLPVYRLDEIGYKYNMNDIQAVLGTGQLKRVENMWERRRRITEIYRSELDSLDSISLQPDQPNVRQAHHLFVVKLGPEFTEAQRNEVMNKLRQGGMGCSIHYFPLHLQPFYQKALGLGPGALPVAEAAAERVISLPIYPLMTDEQVGLVSDALKRALSG